MTPKRFLRKHPEYAKVVHDTTYITKRDTIIVRQEVVVRDTIKSFSTLRTNTEYIIRDTLNRLEIRYIKTSADELIVTGKQLAYADTLKNAITATIKKQQLVRTIIEKKMPIWVYVAFQALLFIILLLVLLRFIKK